MEEIMKEQRRLMMTCIAVLVVDLVFIITISAIYVLLPADKAIIAYFVLFTLFAFAGIVLVIKMKLPVWKFQVVWICITEVIAVFLLVSRLVYG